jgi:hypothetical protein
MNHDAPFVSYDKVSIFLLYLKYSLHMIKYLFTYFILNAPLVSYDKASICLLHLKRFPYSRILQFILLPQSWKSHAHKDNSCISTGGSTNQRDYGTGCNERHGYEAHGQSDPSAAGNDLIGAQAGVIVPRIPSSRRSHAGGSAANTESVHPAQVQEYEQSHKCCSVCPPQHYRPGSIKQQHWSVSSDECQDIP